MHEPKLKWWHPQPPKLYGKALVLDYPYLEYAKRGSKVLIISDSLTKTEAYQCKMLAGDVGVTISNIINAAIKDAGKPPASILCLTTRLMRRPGAVSEAEYAKNQIRIKKYIIKLINRYQPDSVVLLGQSQLEDWLKIIKCKYSLDDLRLLRARLIPVAFGKHKCQMILSVSSRHFATLDYKDFKSKVNILGFVVQDIAIAIRARNLYTLPPMTGKRIIINSIKQFDSFMEKLWQAKTPSIDTEKTNLNRVADTQLLTILFCLDGVDTYMVPYAHPQTPFTGKELLYIKTKLQDFFENSKSKFHIYHTAKFDILTFMVDLGVKFYKNNVFDIAAGAYALDENRKFMGRQYIGNDGLGFTGEGNKAGGVYTLEQLTAEYGGLDYKSTKIKKTDRDRMIDFSLKDIIEYGASDVVNPWHIARFQAREARRRGRLYRGYLKFVTRLLSDTMLTFCDMEKNGVLADKKYLQSLLSPNSELAQALEKAKAKFKAMPNVQKANKILIKRSGVPNKNVGIFGTSQHAWQFDVGKPNHQQILFFDVLGLNPVEYRKDGGGRTGKSFLNEYKATVPEVEALAEYREREKLRNTYIVGIFKKITQSIDNSIDGRLRAVYGFLLILTSRSSSQNPNLQNIPSRGKLAKFIKRIFIAAEGAILVKLDFTAHEVEGWGNISGDKKITEAFAPGITLKRKLRLMRGLDLELDRNLFDWMVEHDWDKLKDMAAITALVKRFNNSDLKTAIKTLLDIKIQGDVHRKNVELFFGTPAAEVTPEARQDVKTTIFGVMYEKMARSLCGDLYPKEVKPIERKYRLLKLKIEREYEGEELKDKLKNLYFEEQTELKPYVDKAQKLINKLFSTFATGGKWIRDTQKRAKTDLRVTTPFCMVRHLYGYLHSMQTVHNRMNRQGPNSIIQGSSSNIGFIGARIMHKIVWRLQNYKINLGWRHGNFVHDSISAESHIKALPISLYYLEHSTTTLVHKHARKVYGHKMAMTMQVDIEIGGSEAAMFKYDGTESGLMHGVDKSIDWMISELGYKLNKKDLLKAVRHNFRIMQKYRLKEMQQLGDSTRASETMLMTPKIAKTLEWSL